MTLAQKLQELHGTGMGEYAGVIPAIPSLCIPALTLQDGPAGAGDGFVGVTQLPAPVALAAAWNPSLAQQYGAVVGAEQWGKGVEVDLGPTVNIVRDPRWGRAFESYSEDPYLNGQIGAGYVRGVQSKGVMAEVKHWAVYNQEVYRNTPADHVMVSKRVMQEIYLPQFDDIIRASHPASMMCSYVTVNTSFACENPYLLTQVLRKEFHYQGFMVSDWGGTHSTVASANAGLNVEMPGDKYYGAALKKAIADNNVSESTIDGLVRPILVQMFRMHLFQHQPTGNTHVVVTNARHVDTAETVAEDGAVLLKNAGSVLPFAAKVHSIAVIGTDGGADAMSAGGGSARVNADSIVSPFVGISQRAGTAIKVRYAQGNVAAGLPPLVPERFVQPETGIGYGWTEKLYDNTSRSGQPVHTATVQRIDWQLWGRSPAAGLKRDQWSATFAGKITPPVTGQYTFSLATGGEAQLFVDGRLLLAHQSFAVSPETATIDLDSGHPVSIKVEYTAAGPSFAGILTPTLRLGWKVPVPGSAWPRQQALLEQAVQLAKSSDVAVVFASKFETEGSDLTDIDLPGDQNRLIEAVAAANPNTIVVLNTGSAVTMPWLRQVKAVIEAWYPGQQDGNAIAALLFGDVNPSGKLPVTFPKTLADVPASTQEQWPGVNGKIVFSAGLDVGYRWYDAKHIQPAFPFGFGLSYTTFKFTNLKVGPAPGRNGAVQASVDITNTGKRSGADVAQIYIGYPDGSGEPPRQLRAFKKVNVAAGQTQHVMFELSPRAFAVWDTQTKAWDVPGGSYTIMVGDASNNLPLHASDNVKPQSL